MTAPAGRGATAAARPGAHVTAAAQTRIDDHAPATGFSKGYLVSAGVLTPAVIIALAVPDEAK